MGFFFNTSFKVWLGKGKRVPRRIRKLALQGQEIGESYFENKNKPAISESTDDSNFYWVNFHFKF